MLKLFKGQLLFSYNQCVRVFIAMTIQETKNPVEEKIIFAHHFKVSDHHHRVGKVWRPLSTWNSDHSKARSGKAIFQPAL
jgi:hypothetical protein